jgi:hypothetical protein
VSGQSFKNIKFTFKFFGQNLVISNTKL